MTDTHHAFALFRDNLTPSARVTFDAAFSSLREGGEANLLINGLEFHASGTMIAYKDHDQPDAEYTPLAGASSPALLATILALFTPPVGKPRIFEEANHDHAIATHLQKVRERRN